ncbi:MAG: FkbM family methyltransferase [Paludibacteraceae bacterium]|nr:FkbM family methyltransferase [Paludibacteraceae bacterium]
MKTAFKLYKLKMESPSEIFINRIYKLILGKEKATEQKYKYHSDIIKRKYLKDNATWNFNGIRLPINEYDENFQAMYAVYLDSLFVYCTYDDNYDCSLIDQLDEVLPEGTYGYKNELIDVTVKKDDIVIDAGAWIGDFSAYASVKGAKVFAFEPGKHILKYLYKTSELNSNITVVEKGLSDESGISYLTNSVGDSSSNQIVTSGDSDDQIELISIDNFVKENNLQRVDFIKADIEGFERNMLLGAKQTLKTFAPKLAICTYHLPDDPQVLAKIILDANPNYVIVQKRKKLYAMVKQ